MDKIEKIKEWVKKQKKEELARNSIGVITGKALFVDANELLTFIDTLSEEPDKSLEEEVKRYYSDNFAYISSDQPTLSILTNIARHFAEWQKEQMMDEWLKDRDGCFWDGVEEGKKAMEEQMNPSGSSEIPNDLEEAAEEIVIKMHPCLKYCTILGDRLTRGQLMALVKAGASWQKEQMLKDAVEGRIGAVGLHNSIFIKEPEWTESIDRLNEGDKVKIIIVKED